MFPHIDIFHAIIVFCYCFQLLSWPKPSGCIKYLIWYYYTIRLHQIHDRIKRNQALILSYYYPALLSYPSLLTLTIEWALKNILPFSIFFTTLNNLLTKVDAEKSKDISELSTLKKIENSICYKYTRNIFEHILISEHSNKSQVTPWNYNHCL